MQNIGFIQLKAYYYNSFVISWHVYGLRTLSVAYAMPCMVSCVLNAIFLHFAMFCGTFSVTWICKDC